MLKSLSKKVLIFNGVSALVIATAAATQIRSVLFPAQPPPCSTTMERSVTLGLTHNGQLIQPSDVQAVSNGNDYGVMDNLSVVSVRNGPVAAGMDIFLRSGSSQQGVGNFPGGISFPWQPRGLPSDLKHACLAYSIYLDPEFDFGEGGSLPGLRGASLMEGANREERFATHVVWGPKGVASQHVLAATNKHRQANLVNGAMPVELPRGRWVRIEQELELNSTGYMDGRARYWIDGRFAGEKREAFLRYSADSFIAGANVNVYFGGQPIGNDWGRGKAIKDERILLSPIEIKWN